MTCACSVLIKRQTCLYYKGTLQCIDRPHLHYNCSFTVILYRPVFMLRQSSILLHITKILAAELGFEHNYYYNIKLLASYITYNYYAVKLKYHFNHKSRLDIIVAFIQLCHNLSISLYSN